MSEPFGVSRSMRVNLFVDGQAASEGGYDYKKWEPRPKALQLNQIVIVKQGTVGGNATLDLVLTDADGNQYVTMTTANLLKSLPI